MKKLLTVILLAFLGCDDDTHEPAIDTNCSLAGYENDYATVNSGGQIIDYEEYHYTVDITRDEKDRITEASSYYTKSGQIRSAAKVYYTGNNEIKILGTNYRSETTEIVVKINNAGNPMEYSGNNDDYWIEYDNSGRLTQVTVDTTIQYKCTYDAAGKNVTKVTRHQDGIVTSEVTISYDDKRNPFKGSWVLMTSVGTGIIDDIYVYFCENNPVKYSVKRFQGSDADSEILIHYEYDDFGFPVRSIVDWSNNYDQFKYTYACE